MFGICVYKGTIWNTKTETNLEHLLNRQEFWKMLVTVDLGHPCTATHIFQGITCISKHLRVPSLAPHSIDSCTTSVTTGRAQDC